MQDKDVPKAEWSSLTLFHNGIPAGVKEFVSDARDSLKNVTVFAEEIISLLRRAQEYLKIIIAKPPSDMIIEAIFDAIQYIVTSVLNDILGLGGGLIVIHPYNVLDSNGRPKYQIDLFEPINVGIAGVTSTVAAYKQVSKKALPTPGTGGTGKNTKIAKEKPFSAPLATLTPHQAFTEFYKSFDNKLDEHRLQFTQDDYVTGVGLLITTPDITAFINLMTTVATFMNFSELSKGISKLVTEVQTIQDNAKAQKSSTQENSDIDFSFFNSDLKNMTTAPIFSSSSVPDFFSKADALFENNLPGYHWFGLTLRNFPLLEDIAKTIENMIASLKPTTKKTDLTAVDDITNAIIKKTSGHS